MVEKDRLLVIGRGMMALPKLLLVDEPSLGLSPKMLLEIFNTLKILHDEGVSILISEQNIQHALRIASRGYVLENGRVIMADSSPEAFRESLYPSGLFRALVFSKWSELTMQDYFSYTDGLFDRFKVPEKPEALKGIRVLDLAHIIFGSVIAKWLALFGAEVIKVEEPYEGDAWRTASYWAKYWKDSSPYFQCLHPNKHFVGIDLKTDKGKELVLELAKKSDVIVENYRAGLTEAWGHWLYNHQQDQP